jgi:hypothetical protein
MPQLITRRDRIVLALILLVAAVLRLSDLGITEYAYDEATLSSLAQARLSGRSVTLGMMSSAQIPNFPASVYVMALPFLASGSARRRHVRRRSRRSSTNSPASTTAPRPCASRSAPAKANTASIVSPPRPTGTIRRSPLFGALPTFASTTALS